jgi:hypothetical protein
MLATTDRSQKLPTSPIPKGRQPVSAKSVAYDEHLGSKIRTLSEENTRGTLGLKTLLLCGLFFMDLNIEANALK